MAPRPSLAAVERDPLLHPEQGACAVGRGLARVRDLNAELAIGVAQAHRRGPLARRVEGAGERLLHDAIGGQVDAGREWHALTADVQLDRQAGCAHARDELGDMGERRLRGERELLVLPAQHPEQRPDLAERLAPGVLHGSERAPGDVGLGAHEPLRRRRLGDHGGERVAHQVVELARDPGALGGHRAGRPGLAVILGGHRLVRERLVEPHPRAHEAPEQDRAADHDRGYEEKVANAARRLVEADHDRRRDDEHDEADMELPGLGARAERVAEDQRREERPDEVRVDRAAQALEDGEDGEGERDRDHRRSPAHGERAGQHEQRGARDEDVAARSVDQEHLDLHLQAQDQRERRVQGSRSTSHGTPTLSAAEGPVGKFRALPRRAGEGRVRAGFE